MIKGHGDDAYRYEGIAIRSDFSSNIYGHTGHHALTEHLTSMMPHLLSHYPEPEAWSLERMLADRLQVSPHSVIVTNGATEAIYLVAQTFGYKPIIPEPTFREYEDACSLYPPTHPEQTMLWLCNPNNPTGQVYDSQLIKEMCHRHLLVVIDQSYEDYTDQTILLPKVADKMMNLIQIHSMTKTYAIPGLRLGYITAPVQLAHAIRHNMRPWSVSTLAIEAGKFLLQHDELKVRPNLQETQRLRQALSRLAGIDCLDTQTSFFLCTIHPQTAAELKDYLAREHRILIRDASNFQGLTPHHFRIATQSPEENDLLVDAINQFIQLQA